VRDSNLQQRRLMAAAIDIAIGLGLAVALGVTFLVGKSIVGAVLGRYSALTILVERSFFLLITLLLLAYTLARDVLGGGRSLGKKSQEIRVVSAAGSSLTLLDSAKRNGLFAIGAAMGVLTAMVQLVPCLGAALGCLLLPLAILAGLASLAVAGVELVQIIQEPSGVRFGDRIAGTRVVE